MPGTLLQWSVGWDSALTMGVRLRWHLGSTVEEREGWKHKELP